MAIYPTWSRFLKLWKTIIYPVLKNNLEINRYSHVYDEVYSLDVADKLTQADVDVLISEIKLACEAKGYEVALNHTYGYDITLLGKDDSLWAPCIDIKICSFEWEDDEILEFEDNRWDDSNIDELNFKSSYAKLLEERNLVDNADWGKIRKSPRKVQEAYCDWFRSEDTEGHLWVEIMPCNM